jgi:hypothetical protein
MPMDSIALELQRDAAGSSVPVAELPRKALLVAKKLDLDDFALWIKAELEGYRTGADVPDYRRVSGELRAKNPMRGWVRVMFDDAEFREALSSAPIGQPISEVEEPCVNSKQLMIRRHEVEQYAELLGQVALPVYLHITAARLKSILQSVRQLVLE